jgi:S-adenosylmethionine synthetase
MIQLPVPLPHEVAVVHPVQMKISVSTTTAKQFQDAKEAVQKYLSACPTEVIRRFINRSWRFVSAYQCGLIGRATAWAVRKQK